MVNPTYHNLGDHTESVQIDYDPTQTSYEQLLRVFWATPNSCATSGSRQYMSAIFYANDAQKNLALASLPRALAGRENHAQVLPLTAFYVAEDYHQKYLLRDQPSLMQEFRSMYPDAKAFMNSTAAARINGFLGGHGTEQMIRQEIDRLGLSEEARKTVLRLGQREP